MTNHVYESKVQVNFIDGTWVKPTERLTATLDDPNTGEFLLPKVATASADVDRALTAAHRLQSRGAWEDAGTDARVALLGRLADGLDPRIVEIGYADAMSNGNPLTVAIQMAGYLGLRVRSARDQLLEVGTSRDLDGGIDTCACSVGPSDPLRSSHRGMPHPLSVSPRWPVRSRPAAR